MQFYSTLKIPMTLLYEVFYNEVLDLVGKSESWSIHVIILALSSKVDHSPFSYINMSKKSTAKLLEPQVVACFKVQFDFFKNEKYEIAIKR